MIFVRGLQQLEVSVALGGCRTTADIPVDRVWVQLGLAPQAREIAGITSVAE